MKRPLIERAHRTPAFGTLALFAIGSLVGLPASAAPTPARAPEPQRVAAILLFPGVQIIDYTGPYEVFGQARFKVHTVARTTEPITTAMGMKVVPELTFSTCPTPDVLVIPGGGVDTALNDVETIAWVRKTSEAAGYTLSVCNGAFIVAKAGLLDGKSATTFHRMIEDLAREYPKTKVVSDQRFVDNGRIITAAGLSSGIDGSLHVLARILGPARAKEIALNMEYDWRPEAGYARAALADMKLPRIDPHGVADARVVETEGDRDRWKKTWEVTSDLSASGVAASVENEIASKTSWKRAIAAPAGAVAPPPSRWEFDDATGKPWTGTVTVRNDSAHGTYRVTIAVVRGG